MSRPVLRAFTRAPAGIAVLAAVAGLVVLAVLGPPLWGAAAAVLDPAQAQQGPSAGHWLGTDRLGRDVLARALAASRTSLLLGVLAAAVAAACGTVVGGAIVSLPARAQVFGRRLVDALLAFPPILVAIVVTAVLGPSASSAAVAVGVAGTPGVVRVITSLATTVTGQDYVAAARGGGLGWAAVFGRHVLPNIADTLIVTLSVMAGTSLVFVSSLSFLGIGVQPPDDDWGRMLAEGIDQLYANPLTALAPAVLIAGAGLVFGLGGEALARAFNPVLWTAPPARHVVAEPDAGPVAPAEPITGAALEVRGLSVRVGSTRLVADVDLTVAPGETLGIVGESGSGKSMTMLAIAGLLPHPVAASAGAIRLSGVDTRDSGDPAVIRRLGTELAMVFQDPMSSLNPAIPIGVQLGEQVRAHLGHTRAMAHELGERRLGEVGVSAPALRMRQYPHELSGGMRQRVMIAMGTMTEPVVLLADEPTTALDVTVQRQVLRLLRGLNRERGTAIVLVSHDLEVVRQLCGRVLVMYAGRVVEEGPTSELIADPRHPYTAALVGATLTMDVDPACELTVLPGSAQQAGEAGPGCAFAPRCPVALDRCAVERPPLVESGGRRTACWVTAGHPTLVGSAR